MLALAFLMTDLRLAAGPPSFHAEEAVVRSFGKSAACISWAGETGRSHVVSISLFGKLEPRSELSKLVTLPGLKHFSVMMAPLQDDDFPSFPADSTLKILSLIACKKLTDRSARVIGSLRSLEWLDVSGTAFTDKGVKFLAASQRLKGLGLRNVRVTDVGMKDIALLSRLEHLDLGNTAITDLGLASLASLQHLRFLSLSDCSVSGNGLRHMVGSQNLEELDLGYTELSDDDINFISTFPQLRKLSLRSTRVSTMKRLRIKTQLHHLDLSGTAITDSGLAGLAECPCLVSLNVSFTKTTDKGLVELGRNAKLRILEARSTNVRFHSPKLVRGLAGLERIDLRMCDQIDDKALRNLSQLQKLTWLRLESDLITDAGVMRLTKLTKLTRLHLYCNKVTSQAISDLQKANPKLLINPQDDDK